MLLSLCKCVIISPYSSFLVFLAVIFWDNKVIIGLFSAIAGLSKAGYLIESVLKLTLSAKAHLQIGFSHIKKDEKSVLISWK